MGILESVLLGFVVALVAPYISKATKEYSGWVLALVPFSLFVYYSTFIGQVSAGEVIRQETPWLPGMDVHMSFLIDGLGLLFALIITGVGTFILIYGGGYLKGHPYIGRFYLAVLMFMGSMLGVVLSDNLLALFVFWELTSFTSYLLIGFNHESKESRKAALQALIVTGTGGLALLAGVIMMALIGGSMEISELLSHSDAIKEHSWYLAILILVLAGAFTKSAQFPFHFWLPGAMAAPTPVSAYLHSATMVKAGVYLMARFFPILGETDLWMMTLTGFGAVTMLVGAWLALSFTDLKQILAYSTVMALGTLTMLLGMGHPYAIKAAAVFVLGHSFYKGALFMVAGSIDHETGTRNVLQLGGLRKLMPITAICAAVAAISMAGIAPMLGFIGKELVYEASLTSEIWSVALITIAVLANVAVVASSAIVAIRPFYGEEKETPKHAHEAPVSMWLGPAFLGFFGLLFGVLPFLIDKTLFTPTATSIAGIPMEVSLSLWHGINLPLILSIITLLLGLLVFWKWDAFRDGKAMQGFADGFARAPITGYEKTITGMLGLADIQTRLFQSGYLHYYMITLVVITILGASSTFFLKHSLMMPDTLGEVRFYEVVVVITMIAGAVAAALARTALIAITSLGMMGFSIALLFVFFSAPDLAITQFLIETLTVILVALVLVHLPKPSLNLNFSHKVRDIVIAAAAGTMVTVLMLGVLMVDFNTTLTDYFAETSYVLAHGKNIVNVILVDYRGVDTMGEITVLAVAGFGIYALVKLMLPKKKEKEA